MDSTQNGILPEKHNTKKGGQAILEALQKNDFNYGPHTLSQEKRQVHKRTES